MFDNLKAGTPPDFSDNENATLAQAHPIISMLLQCGLNGARLYANPDSSGASTTNMIPEFPETFDPDSWVDTSQALSTMVDNSTTPPTKGVPQDLPINLVAHFDGDDPQNFHNIGIMIHTFNQDPNNPQDALGKVLDTFAPGTGASRANSFVSNLPEVKVAVKKALGLQLS